MLKQVVTVEQHPNPRYDTQNPKSAPMYVYRVTILKNRTLPAVGSYIGQSEVELLIDNGTEVIVKLPS